MSGRTQESRTKSAARTASGALPAVAINVKRLRARKGYTVEALASECGVEAATIARLERGQSTGTIALLWSLARALGVPFGALVTPPGSHGSEADQVFSHGRGRDGDLICRPVLPSRQGPRRTEVYELTLAARATRIAAPRPAGAIDNLLVTSGTVVIGVGKLSHLLKAGDSLDFHSDVERTYSNPSDRETKMYVVITYAENIG